MSHYLCDDLILDIFERLPTKSLVRFRCLSKSWCSTIASSKFIHKNRLRSSQKFLIRRFGSHWLGDGKNMYSLHSEDQFLLYQQPGYFDTSTLEFPCRLSKVANSCNGILCLFDDQSVSLWNPSIRRRLTLPDHISFHPHCSSEREKTAFGFGFDPINNDYKILKIFYFWDKFDGVVTIKDSDVYSMKTRSWSSIAFPPKFDHLRLHVCFLNGVLHWVASNFFKSHMRHHYIMTFNLSTHLFGKIRLPKPCWDTKIPTIIDGCLSVISYDGKDYCWVWVMKEYNNVASWYPHLKLRSNPVDGVIKGVMQLSTNGFFLINYPGRLEVYNPETGVRFALLENNFYKVKMYTCVESLELLDSGELES